MILSEIVESTGASIAWAGGVVSTAWTGGCGSEGVMAVVSATCS